MGRRACHTLHLCGCMSHRYTLAVDQRRRSDSSEAGVGQPAQCQHQRNPPSDGLSADTAYGHAAASRAPQQALQRPRPRYGSDARWFNDPKAVAIDLASGADVAARSRMQEVPDLNLCPTEVVQSYAAEASPWAHFSAEAGGDAPPSSLLEGLALAAEQWSDPQRTDMETS